MEIVMDMFIVRTPDEDFTCYLRRDTTGGFSYMYDEEHPTRTTRRRFSYREEATDFFAKMFAKYKGGDGAKVINKWLRTERGTILARYSFPTIEAAMKAGFDYAFTSHEYGNLYSRPVEGDMNCRHFAIIA